MTKKIIALFIVTCLISYGLFSWLNFIVEKKPLSQEDVKTHIEKLYNAKVQSIIMESDVAITSFAARDGIYEVKVTLDNGKVSNLKLVHQLEKEAEPAPKEEPKLEPPSKEQPSKPKEQQSEKPPTQQVEKPQQSSKPQQEQPPQKQQANPVRITKQQAINIALKQQPGIVDDIDFKKTSDGGIYEVEIEHGDYETVFFIHAITGKILSVEFDD